MSNNCNNTNDGEYVVNNNRGVTTDNDVNGDERSDNDTNEDRDSANGNYSYNNANNRRTRGATLTGSIANKIKVLLINARSIRNKMD